MYGRDIALPRENENEKAPDAESILIDRFQGGDVSAFEDLFTLYRDMVYRLAYRLLGEREEALDLCQEVFLAVYKDLGRFRRSSRFRTWLYRIVVNRAYNRTRLWKRRHRHMTVSLDALRMGHDGAPLGTTMPASGHGPFEQVYSREIEGHIQQALTTLPLDQRAAVIMRDIEGLSYEEIAELLDINLGTVKSRIARGREELRQRLQGVLG